MNNVKKISVCGFLGLFAIAATGACYGTPEGDESVADVELALSAPNFDGNSVKICGERKKPADKKYGCISDLGDLDPWDFKMVDGCPCFDFKPDGTLKDGKVKGLCPSDNVPSGPDGVWTFDYQIFSQEGCTGDVLNTDDDAHNLVCYDEKDIPALDYPNQSVEELKRGRNENRVICITKEASKTWDFDVCADVTEDYPGAPLRLDCDCKYVSGACACEQFDGPPPYCQFAADNSCEIVCQ